MPYVTGSKARSTPAPTLDEQITRPRPPLTHQRRWIEGKWGVSKPAARRAASYARQRLAHDAAAFRRAAEREREAAERHAADALLGLEAKLGKRADALERLSQVSRTLDRIRLEEDAALIERDYLITQLREVGESWNSHAARTGLSRQALSKRCDSRSVY